MATVVSQHVRHLGHQLGYFKKIILRKTASNFTEISRKHVFADSNRNIIIRTESKEEIRTYFVKSHSFLFQTLICLIYYAYIIRDDVIQLMSKKFLIIRIQVLKVSF